MSENNTAPEKIIVYRLIGANPDYKLGVHFLTIGDLLEELRDTFECELMDFPGEKLNLTFEAVEMTRQQFEDLEEV